MKIYVFIYGPCACTYVLTYRNVNYGAKIRSVKPDLTSLLSTWVNPGHDDISSEHLTETKCNAHKHYSIINLDEN